MVDSSGVSGVSGRDILKLSEYLSKDVGVEDGKDKGNLISSGKEKEEGATCYDKSIEGKPLYESGPICDKLYGIDELYEGKATSKGKSIYKTEVFKSHDVHDGDESLYGYKDEKKHIQGVHAQSGIKFFLEVKEYIYTCDGRSEGEKLHYKGIRSCQKRCYQK